MEDLFGLILCNAEVQGEVSDEVPIRLLRDLNRKHVVLILSPSNARANDNGDLLNRNAWQGMRCVPIADVGCGKGAPNFAEALHSMSSRVHPSPSFKTLNLADSIMA